MAAWWGWYVSTVGAYVSPLGVSAAIPSNCTIGDCAAVIGLDTLGYGGVRDMRVFGVGGMRALHHFPRSLIFGLGSGGTVVNWNRLSHRLKSSRSSVIALNYASQVIGGASFREQESVFILCRILSACVSVGCVR